MAATESGYLTEKRKAAMSNSCACFALVLCGFLALSCTARAAETEANKPSPELDEFRAKFIEDFERIGLNTAPGDAMFLRIMVESSRAKLGIEVGTATGYGAMLMGLGFEHTGGRLFTIEIDPRMAKAARANIAAMKLDDSVTLIEGDALKVLPTLKGEVDFLFIDAVKSDYLKYFKAIEPKLTPGAVIVADNVIRSANAMQDFLDFMKESKDYQMVIIRASELKHDGMAVIYKVK